MTDFSAEGGISPGWLLVGTLADAVLGDAAVCTLIDSVDKRERPPLELNIPSHEVNSDTELMDTVNALLCTRPVVLLPPWGRLPGEKVERQELIALGCQAKPNCRDLILVVPASSLLSHRAEGFRRRFFTDWRPSAIVFFTGGLAGVHSAFRTAIVQVVARNDDDGLLRMFETPPQWIDQVDAVTGDLRRLLRMAGGATEFGYVLR